MYEDHGLGIPVVQVKELPFSDWHRSTPEAQNIFEVLAKTYGKDAYPG